MGLVALTVVSPVCAVYAQGTPATLFTCAIGKKTVSVTQADGKVTYHYGANGKDEMAIVGAPASGNVFQMSQRFAGMEYQLRFMSGEYSYIVYDSEGNDRSGAAASSGLVVMQGAKRISDRPCARFAEFATSIDSLGLPEDTEAFSAM
jgi:hypothetical protein